MTDHDPPNDWASPSLTDPEVAHAVLDDILTLEDRLIGGLAVLFCSPAGRLLQPLILAAPPEGPEGHAEVFDWILRLCRDVEEGVAPLTLVLALVRAEGELNDTDRQWHQHALAACRDQGVRLVSTHLVSGELIEQLPVAVKAA